MEYLADHMSLFEVPDLIDWKSKAIQNIERIRKADITLRYDIIWAPDLEKLSLGFPI